MINKSYDFKKKVICACSGGVDSMYLSFLLLNQFAHLEVHALIVNHNLRPSSTEEAMQTKIELEKMGYKHVVILNWQHEEVKTKIEEEARTARFNLIFEYALMNGIEDVVLAHHLDDLIENFFLKLGSGAGLYGLCGLKEENVIKWHGRFFRLVRPLLFTSKAEIICEAQKNCVKFITDYSNFSDNFKRNRLRKNLPEALKLMETSKNNILNTVLALSNAHQVLIKNILNLFNTVFIFDFKLGFFKAEYSSVKMLTEEELFFIVKEIVFYFSGRTNFKKADLVNASRFILQKKSFTLGFTHIFFKQGFFYFIKEAKRIENRIMFDIWDERFYIKCKRKEFTIKLIDFNLERYGIKHCIAGKIIKTLPSVWAQGELLAIPFLKESEEVDFLTVSPFSHLI